MTKRKILDNGRTDAFMYIPLFEMKDHCFVGKSIHPPWREKTVWPSVTNLILHMLLQQFCTTQERRQLTLSRCFMTFKLMAETLSSLDGILDFKSSF